MLWRLLSFFSHFVRWLEQILYTPNIFHLKWWNPTFLHQITQTQIKSFKASISSLRSLTREIRKNLIYKNSKSWEYKKFLCLPGTSKITTLSRLINSLKLLVQTYEFVFKWFFHSYLLFKSGNLVWVARCRFSTKLNSYL